MISKEDMRNARLRAMGASAANIAHSDSNSREVDDQGCNERNEKKRYLPSDNFSPLPQSTLGAVKRLMYENGGATDEDILRWYNQGFVFCNEPSFGLRQGNGGPCGILAVVQAEILKLAIFSDSLDKAGVSCLPTLSPPEVQRILASACSSILARAAEGRVDSGGFICVVDCPSLTLHPSSSASDLIVHQFHSENEAARFILEKQSLFSSNVGCIVFLISLLLSRGLDRVSQDMDMESNTLIGAFGYCSQELLNLLLTGSANSNIMDGNVSMNGIVVKGISQRSSVGYLTHLESLRYCEAGDFYKVPIFPIWVIGSTSHFTVLFALDRRVNHETESERLLSLAQRAFKSADPEENGFICADKLKEVLEVLKCDEIIKDDVELARLRGHLQIDGGIILWSGFWENVSKLMSKQMTLDSLINTSAVSKTSMSEVAAGGRERSDSDLARELQAEMDGSPLALSDTGSRSVSTASTYQFQIVQDSRPRSDSDIARELQAQWNNEEFASLTDAPSLTAIESRDSFPSVSSPVTSPVRDTATSSFSPSIRSGIHRHDSIADDQAVQHLLFHFNGLESTSRPARLTPFKLIPRSSQNAIGVSVAMGGALSNSSSGCCPIEEVLRTRWPGSRIDWMGSAVPSID